MLEALTEPVVTALLCAGSVYGVIKTELRFLQRDIDHAHTRIDHIERTATSALLRAARRSTDQTDG